MSNESPVGNPNRKKWEKNNDNISSARKSLGERRKWDKRVDEEVLRIMSGRSDSDVTNRKPLYDPLKDKGAQEELNKRKAQKEERNSVPWR